VPVVELRLILLRWKIQMSVIGTLVVRTYGGTCESSLSSGHRLVSVMEAHCVLCEVKQSHYRPEQAHRVPGGRGFQISRQSAHEGGEVVSPTHLPPLLTGTIPDTHFCWRLSQPQGHNAAGRIMSMKNSSGTIGNRTRDLVAQCLNQLRHRVPRRL
jgi:hypothetical protein